MKKGVRATALFVVIVISVAFGAIAARWTRSLLPRSSEPTGLDALRLVAADFGGIEHVPASLKPLNARVEHGWDGSTTWALYRFPTDEYEMVKGVIVDCYNRKPASACVVIDDADTPTVDQVGAPLWWDPGTAHPDVLRIRTQGASTLWIFSKEHGVACFHRLNS